MKNLVKLTIVLALVSAAFGQTTPTRVRSVTTLPATCQAGDGIKPADMVALVASGFSTPYICGVTNTWYTPLQFSGIGTIPYYPANGITAVGDPNLTTDGAGHLQAVNATFVGAGTAGFAGFGQGTVPSLANSHTAYLYAATSVATSFGTMLPSSPGTVGQALVIATAPDGTHITTSWSGVARLNSASDQTIVGGFSLINDGGSFRATNTAATPSTSAFNFLVNGSGRGSIAFSGSGSSNIFFDVDGGLVFNPAIGSVQGTTYNNAGVLYAGASASFSTGVSCAFAPHGLCSAVYQQPIFLAGNTSGGTILYPQDIAGSHAIGFPAADGTASLAIVENCGTSTTCAQTVLTNPIIVRGDVTFPTATTVSLSSLPFTSSSSYSCTASDLTSAAGVVNATTYTSGAAVTFTETGGSTTDHARYICVGN